MEQQDHIRKHEEENNNNNKESMHNPKKIRIKHN